MTDTLQGPDDLKGPNSFASKREEESPREKQFAGQYIEYNNIFVEQKFKYTKLYPSICARKMVMVIVASAWGAVSRRVLNLMLYSLSV